jgi:hypothetical protein
LAFFRFESQWFHPKRQGIGTVMGGDNTSNSFFFKVGKQIASCIFSKIINVTKGLIQQQNFSTQEL